MLSNVIQASDVRMIQGTTAEEILEESLDVMETNGEWELAGIGIAPYALTLEDGSYSEIKYHVSAFTYYNYVVSHRFGSVIAERDFTPHTDCT